MDTNTPAADTTAVVKEVAVEVARVAVVTVIGHVAALGILTATGYTINKVKARKARKSEIVTETEN